jgi:DNA-binding MarR family transcriptional regulator
VARIDGVAVFVETVDAAGFARAAERLALTRSAVAKAIARLETRLGVRLFHRTTRALSLTEDGQMALHLAGMSGSSARSRRTPEEQSTEFRVLDYLAMRETAPGEPDLVREESLRSATRVSKTVLAGMVRKKWLIREDVSAAQDATRTVKIAIL